MRVIVLSKNGKLEEKNFTRTSFSAMFKTLRTRDLRPVFSSLQVSTILINKETIILNMGFLKVVLTPDKAYFMIHRSEDEIRKIVRRIISELKSKNKEFFILIVLEILFDEKLKQFRTKVLNLEEQTNKILTRIRKKFTDKDMESLLIIKKRLSKLETRHREILSAIEDIVDDPEELEEIAELVGGENFLEEIESIFENFLEQVEDIGGIIFRMSENIEDNEEFVNMTLNARRTVFVRINLIATIFTVILSFLAVVVGLYGTNIKNGLEDNIHAFYVLTLVLILTFILSSTIILVYLKIRKLL